MDRSSGGLGLGLGHDGQMRPADEHGNDWTSRNSAELSRVEGEVVLDGMSSAARGVYSPSPRPSG